MTSHSDNHSPKNHPFKMRGENMTRIETFVAAAFAFAVTMLVISVGTVPESMQEFVDATKQIPAFTASCAIIVWIWHTHANWCRRYGLEDGTTIFLSASLIVLVLTYIYPLRLIMQSLFNSLSSGYLPMDLVFNQAWEARFMFGFYSTGFLLLCLNFIALYLYAISKKDELQLDDVELFDSRKEIYMWLASAGIALTSLLFSIWLPITLLGMSGYILFTLFPILTGLGLYSKKRRKRLVTKLQQNVVPIVS